MALDTPIDAPASTRSRVVSALSGIAMLILGAASLWLSFDTQLIANRVIAAGDPVSSGWDSDEAEIVGQRRVGLFFLADVIRLPDGEARRVITVRGQRQIGDTVEVRRPATAEELPASAEARHPIRYVGQEQDSVYLGLFVVAFASLTVGCITILVGARKLLSEVRQGA